jgi:hypothetical protein
MGRVGEFSGRVPLTAASTSVFCSEQDNYGVVLTAHNRYHMDLELRIYRLYPHIAQPRSQKGHLYFHY